MVALDLHLHLHGVFVVSHLHLHLLCMHLLGVHIILFTHCILLVLFIDYLAVNGLVWWSHDELVSWLTFLLGFIQVVAFSLVIGDYKSVTDLICVLSNSWVLLLTVFMLRHHRMVLRHKTILLPRQTVPCHIMSWQVVPW